MRQKRDHRRNSLIKKSSEYSKICDADVCLGIRIRETGRVYIFSADDSGFWTFVGSQLVGTLDTISLPMTDSIRPRTTLLQTRQLIGTLA